MNYDDENDNVDTSKFEVVNESEEDLILTNQFVYSKNTTRENEQERLEVLQELKEIHALYNKENRALACWDQVEKYRDSVCRYKILANMKFPHFINEFF